MNDYQDSPAPYIPDKRFFRQSLNAVSNDSAQPEPYTNPDVTTISLTSGSFIYPDPVVPLRSSLVDKTLSSQISMTRKCSSPQATLVPKSSKLCTVIPDCSSISSLTSAFLTDEWGLIEAANFQSVASDNDDDCGDETIMSIDLTSTSRTQRNSVKWPGIVNKNPFGPFEPFQPEKYANDTRIINSLYPQSRDVFDQVFSTCRKDPEEEDSESGYESNDPDSLGFRLQREMVLAACNNYDNMGTTDELRPKPSIKARIKSIFYFKTRGTG